MSKEIIITVIILIGIILLNLLVSNFVDDKLNHMLKELDELGKLMEEEKYDEANKKLQEINDYWEKSENLMSYFIEHDELEKVVTEYTSLKAYLKLEQEEAYESLEKMAYIIRHIEEKDDLKLKNIF